ncbi:hypothetical protein Scep_005951 [Stephania cephalantha]|uniref:Uncharacterized protein n=1 Tax=Stephania cephalantha TaxID=152367 RepID=A0AAP0K8M4_9MAGN
MRATRCHGDGWYTLDENSSIYKPTLVHSSHFCMLETNEIKYRAAGNLVIAGKLGV